MMQNEHTTGLMTKDHKSGEQMDSVQGGLSDVN